MSIEITLPVAIGAFIGAILALINQFLEYYLKKNKNTKITVEDRIRMLSGSLQTAAIHVKEIVTAFHAI